MSDMDGADDIVMSMYTVYRIRRGGAAGFSVRQTDIVRGDIEPRPGPVLGECRTIEVARSMVPREADACLMRSADDHPSIVETWM